MMVQTHWYLFLGFVHHPVFDEAQYFGSQLCFPLQAWKTPITFGPLDTAILSLGSRNVVLHQKLDDGQSTKK